MSEDVRYEVRNEEIENLLRSLAHKLKAMMPRGWGFSLFLFSFGEMGASFYISSAERESFLTSMQEFMLRNGYVLLKTPARPTDDIGGKPDS